MNKKKFKAVVEQELRSFSYKQKKTFAWRCALRALPFLNHKGTFNCWREDDIQRHLYAVFFALDFASADSVDADFASADASASADAAYASGAYVAYAAAAFAAYASGAYAAVTNATRLITIFSRKELNLERWILQDLQDL